jgi:hypothetical protein
VRGWTRWLRFAVGPRTSTTHNGLHGRKATILARLAVEIGRLGTQGDRPGPVAGLVWGLATRFLA